MKDRVWAAASEAARVSRDAAWYVAWDAARNTRYPAWPAARVAVEAVGASQNEKLESMLEELDER